MTGEDADTEQFISSHEPADNSYGQTGSPQSPSLKPGQTKPPIADVSPPVPDAAIIAARGAGIAHDQDSLAFRVKGSDVPTHAGMRSRSGEGGVVAQKTKK
jgi:hypothetical protein